MSNTDKSIENKNTSFHLCPMEVGGMTPKGFLWGNVQQRIVWWVYNSENVLKATELYTLKGDLSV